MWNCAECGVQNPGHALFCRRCGRMRVGVQPLVPREEAAPVRADVGPEPAGEPILPPWPPEPPGCGFVAGWTAATAGAEFLGTIVLMMLYGICYRSAGPSSDSLGFQMGLGVLAGAVRGSAVGGAQAMMLSASVAGRRRMAWWIATLAAWVPGSAILHIVHRAYFALGVLEGGRGGAQLVGGALFGLLVGAAQAFALGKIATVPGRIVWVLVNLFIFTTISAAQGWISTEMLSEGRTYAPCVSQLIFWMILPVGYGGIIGFSTGAMLIRILRRAARASGEPRPPSAP